MIIKKILLSSIFPLLLFQVLCAIPLAEQFKQVGYVEICDTIHGAADFDALYARFDELIDFLQANPRWMQKLYIAKERFIRSKERAYYSTDFFGFYDDSKNQGAGQISFYYSIHFHECICSYCPEFKQVPQIIDFLKACSDIQQSYADIFEQAALELHLDSLFSCNYGRPPILFKVVKYLPSYIPTKPHYDGTAFSLFLDSTDMQSLLLSPYKSVFTVDDFSIPVRNFSRSNNQNSMLLIPGAFLKEFSIGPTPHIVMQSGNVRHAAIAFAMRPNYNCQNNNFSSLPCF